MTRRQRTRAAAVLAALVAGVAVFAAISARVSDLPARSVAERSLAPTSRAARKPRPPARARLVGGADPRVVPARRPRPARPVRPGRVQKPIPPTVRRAARPGRTRAAGTRARASVRAATRSTSRVAYARPRRVAVYGSPGNARPLLTLPNPAPSGARLAFLVASSRPGWVRVHPPTRPNGSAGWVQRADVAVLRNHYRVEVDLSDHVLRVRKRGRVLTSQTVAIGAAGTPTPTGLYYIVELIRTDDPDGPYGPYAYALSAHSDVLQRFDGSDGRVGIHGTNAPGALGSDVSHGCIRVRNGAIELLAKHLPLATPVVITA